MNKGILAVTALFTLVCWSSMAADFGYQGRAVKQALIRLSPGEVTRPT